MLATRYRSTAALCLSSLFFWCHSAWGSHAFAYTAAAAAVPPPQGFATASPASSFLCPVPPPLHPHPLPLRLSGPRQRRVVPCGFTTPGRTALRASPAAAAASSAAAASASASAMANVVPFLRGGGGGGAEVAYSVCGGSTTTTALSGWPVSVLSAPSVAAAAAWQRDGEVALLGLLGATAWLRVWTSLAAAGRIDPKVSRKVVHTGSAPLFVLTWPFFSSATAAAAASASAAFALPARAVAALVPLAFALRLVAARFGRQPQLVKAISRSGSAAEATGGPLTYCAVLLACTVVGWRDSPAAVVAIAHMAVGDGLADLVGRRWGKSNQWADIAFPERPGWRARVGSKSVAGSAALAAGGWGASLGLLAWLHAFGLCTGAGLSLAFALGLGLVSLACAAVELLLPADRFDDNLTVPITAAALVTLLLGVI